MIQKIVHIDVSLLRGYFIFVFFICGGILIHSNTFAQDYRISYDNGLLTLSADKADIKTILLSISKKTNVFIQYPSKLKKQITIKLSNVSIRNALSRLLKGQDYAIIYTASKKHNNESISEVYVLPEQWGNRKPARYQPRVRRENRMERSLRNYERRLDSLRNRLTKVNQRSREGRRILGQIRSIEKTIERLQKKLRR
jgi:hypothetical protein